MEQQRINSKNFEGAEGEPGAGAAQDFESEEYVMCVWARFVPSRGVWLLGLHSTQELCRSRNMIGNQRSSRRIE